MFKNINSVFSGLKAGLGFKSNNALLMPNFRRVKQTFICRDADGNIKWIEEIENLTTTVGLNDMLTQYWKGSAYTAAFYIGLKGAGTIAAGDTMASHAGWTESAAYSNANRPTLTLGTVAAGSVDNSGSLAVFNINATATIAGAFITTNNTKSGTTGTLVGASDFASSRSVISGDTLSVQFTLTQA